MMIGASLARQGRASSRPGFRSSAGKLSGTRSGPCTRCRRRASRSTFSPSPQTRLFAGRVRKEETSANAVKLTAMMEKPGAPREKEAAETAEGIQSHDVCSTDADHRDEELKKAEKDIGKKD